MPHPFSSIKFFKHHLKNFTGMAIGAFLAAVALRVLLSPNDLIDGGVIGVSMILAKLFGDKWLSLFLILLNLPFLYLAFRFIRRSFVFYMAAATILFAFFLAILESRVPHFEADILEAIVFGGALLGVGAGMIIRFGGCTDGTEILAIMINRKRGYTVGQVVLFINIFIFAAYGFIFADWHIALRSLMTYVVAFKMIDLIITGLDELKSVLIFSSDPKKLSKTIMQELGLGLTIIKGKGGYSGEEKDILFIIVERLDLSDLKELVINEDPGAFMAIENLHEVAAGKIFSGITQKRRLRKKKGGLFTF